MLLCNSKTALKMKFWIKDFFSTCDQIRRKLYVYSYLQKKFLMETFIFLPSANKYWNKWSKLYIYS